MSDAALEATETIRIDPAAGSPYWRGALTWVIDGDVHRPWRLPPQRARRAHAPGLIEVAQMAAGVRLELITDATALRLPLTFAYDTPGTLDVTVDGQLADRIALQGAHTLTHELPAGEHEVCIWLPQVGRTGVGTLELVGATAAEPLPERPRWITYGSSISQCSAAAGPSETWPAIVATNLGWDLVCLGMSGQCHLDPIVEHAIAAQPADLISMCLGINIHNGGSFSERSFAPQVSGFLERVRDAHPGTPIAVITPIGSPEREASPSGAGFDLAGMRAALAEVVDVLAEEDPDVSLIDGLAVLGVHEAHLLPDGLHPDAEGYRLMGTRLTERLGALV